MIRRAGVSRRTFYDQFQGWEEAFRSAYDEGFEHLYAATISVLPRPGDRGASAPLRAALEFAARDDAAARLIFIEALCAGPLMARHYYGSLDRLAPLLLRQDNLGPAALAAPATLRERALLGAFAGIVAARLHAGAGMELPALAGDLSELFGGQLAGSTGRSSAEPSSSHASSSPKKLSTVR